VYAERLRQWRAENPEKVKAQYDRQYAANPEVRRAAARRYREKHLDRVKDRERRFRQANKAKVNEKNRRRSALKGDFTLDQLAQKMAYWGDRCWVCSGPFEAVDHVKPRAKGGAHMLCNLRPICHSCNSRKGAKWEGLSCL
jgi:5-methylcytosine-specific restriction endonuclease McrA